MFKHAVWLDGIASVIKITEKMFWFDCSQIIFYILNFLNIYLEKFLVHVVCFQLFFFTYFLFHILILYYILLILKHMFKSTCINCMSEHFKHICILYIMLFKKNIYVSITTVSTISTEIRLYVFTNCSYQKLG